MTHFQSTSECAQILRVKPETIRRGYCVAGHYLKVVPVKLPNGRLLWPEKAVERIIQKGMAYPAVEPE